MGIVEPPLVEKIVADGLEKAGVRTSCLGFGEHYNEDLMTQLAQVTGGHFYDADSAERFPAIFSSELEGLQKTVVQNLRLRLRRLDFCELINPLGNYPAVNLPTGWAEYSVGDLVSAESRVVCFELGVLPLPWLDGRPVASLQGEQLLEMQVQFDEIGESEITSRIVSQIIRIQATQDANEVRQKAEVVAWVAMQKAGQVMDETTRRMDARKLQEAVVGLQNAIAALKAYGPEQQIAEAIQKLERLRQIIEVDGWTARERKSSRYLSHSYRQMSSHELWSGPDAAPSFKKPPAPPTAPITPAPPPGEKPNPDEQKGSS